MNAPATDAPGALISGAPDDRELPQPGPDGWDLDHPALYLNRELTWLAFNRRVLHEAEDPRNPLLERIKFLAIVSSNLDEFFMKRIGGLKQQVGAHVARLTVDGRSPQQQINACYALVREMEEQRERLLNQLLDQLAEHDIRIQRYCDMPLESQQTLRDHYYRNIFPLVTPQVMDPAHPFPFISNLSLNLLVQVRVPGRAERLSLVRIKVPVDRNIPRFLRVGDRHHYVPLEEVIAQNLDMLLPQVEIVDRWTFRVTRNSNTERNEEHADDLLALIESELRDRRFAPIVRLQVERCMPPAHRGMLAAELGLDEASDVFENERMTAMRDLFQIAAIDMPQLRDPPFQPLDHAELVSGRNIFHIIRERGPLLIQTPYESFVNSVERLLKEAADDPKVHAIKMTLYRTSGDSKVVDYLIRAAENGKQVAVVVELKARFDEQANIQWAARMEEAGVHVTYGVLGLKTHCKVIQVVRYDFSGLRRYMHIGTGNYNASTARLYSDLGLFTNDEVLGEDVTELFNFLTTGLTPQRRYKKLLPSPKLLKKALLEKIERERKLHSEERPSLIQFKMNALEDTEIVRALYEAARSGVKIDLIIRDTCRLRPGLPGLSESVTVTGIVGRFLEHTRIYYFRNGGEEEYFIGSADAMKRNLESRVEVVVPVEDSKLRKELRKFLDIQLGDRRNGWEMQADGSYLQRMPPVGESGEGCQEQLIRRAAKRLKDSKKQAKVRQTPEWDNP